MHVIKKSHHVYKTTNYKGRPHITYCTDVVGTCTAQHTQDNVFHTVQYSRIIQKYIPMSSYLYIVF
jgi:hypothetical protein